MKTFLLLFILLLMFIAGIGYGRAAREEKVGQTKMQEALQEASRGRRQMWRYRLKRLFWAVVALVAGVVVIYWLAGQ